VTFYGDYLEVCEDFAPNFGDRTTGCCIMTTQSHASFFPREFFTKNNMTVVPHPPYSFLFPRLKLQFKGRHFDTNEVIEAESQAMLNTLAEHDLRDAFKKIIKFWERKGTTSRAMVATRPIVNF
jgi:hypothetical protein